MNKVVHFEIPAKDMDKAKAFYEKVFGWKIDDFDKEYYMATTGPTEDWRPTEPGFINGGFFKRTGTKDSPMLVIQVDSIEDTVKALTAAGGKLVEEKYMIEHVGYYAEVTDQEGNLIGLMEG